MLSSKEKKEASTLEKIIVQIGPYFLIVVSVTLIGHLASKPLDSNSWVSIGILIMVIALYLFFDLYALKAPLKSRKYA